ncbi:MULTISPECIES: hypothetical protein [Rhizobium/Agrobacterium group]|nr:MULTISPECIES: hypothetical protein [Rhizobium/Agrobacterium group]
MNLSHLRDCDDKARLQLGKWRPYDHDAGRKTRDLGHLVIIPP